VATEQKTPRVKKLREQFDAERDNVDYKNYVWIDEAGCNLKMSKKYGWSKKGERANGLRPARYCENYTMIGALNEDGVSTLMASNSGTTGAVFLGFVKQYLLPTLRPGDIVVMDNLASHKVVGVKEAIESVGASVKYLPPYSPDMNPIENCWSKMKESIRGIGARTYQKLDAAIAEAMELVSASDVEGWAAHCGYAT
jgi:transposase